MDDREGSPERITDLLQQDDYMFEEEAPTPTAEQAEKRQAAFGQANNGPVKQGSGASKRVPIPAPPKPASAPPSTPAAEGTNANGVAAPLGPGPKRFFIIKSNSAYNIDLSVENGVWATQVGAAALPCLSTPDCPACLRQTHDVLIPVIAGCALCTISCTSLLAHACVNHLQNHISHETGTSPVLVG